MNKPAILSLSELLYRYNNKQKTRNKSQLWWKDFNLPCKITKKIWFSFAGTI